MKKFEGLLKSEITTINKFAQKRDGKDSKISGYSYSGEDEFGFVKVKCEICSNNGKDREADVIFLVFMPNRLASDVCEALSKRRASWI